MDKYRDYQTGMGNVKGLIGVNDYKPAPPPIERDSIASALTEQESYLTDLHSAVSHMTQVLETVLEEEGPSTGAGAFGGEASVAPSGVLRRVRGNSRTLSEAIGRINRLAARVQL